MLVVSNKHSAAWILRYYSGGQERWHGLGSLSVIGLKEARERARKARELLLGGQDPIDQKRAAKASRKASEATALTFKQAALAYLDQHRGKWTNRKVAQQFRASLTEYAFPLIGDLAVADITTPIVLGVLRQPVAARRGLPAGPFWNVRPTTASRVRARIEATLAWAIVNGYRGVQGDNPARWRGHLDKALPAHGELAPVEHHAAMPYAQVPSLLAALKEREGSAGKALQFLIYTAARTSEVLGARWSEIDFATATWTIPATRMKNRKPHRVPLAPAAIELLRNCHTEPGNEHIFIGSRGARLSDDALGRVLGRIRCDFTVHGLRSSFRDFCAERTNFSSEICEAALSHATGSGVERAYKRTDLFDRRRKLMEQWATFCLTTPVATGAKVVPLRQAADGQ
jgi:integrase